MTRYSGSTALAFPALQEIGDSLIIEEGSPTTLALPALTHLGGDLGLAAVTVGLVAPMAKKVDGSVRVEGANLSAVDLSGLTEINGSLSLRDSTVGPAGRLSLPKLARIGRQLEVTRVQVSEVRLDALTGPLMSMEFRLDSQLALVSLGALKDTGGDLRVTDNSYLVLEAPLLSRVGGNLDLSGNGSLRVHLPRLTELVGNLQLVDTNLLELAVPALRKIDRHLHVLRVSWLDLAPPLPALETIGVDFSLRFTQGLPVLALPKLATIGGVYGGFPLGSLTLEDNLDLKDLSFPLLTRIEVNVSIQRNLALDSSLASSRLASTAVGGSALVCSNLGAAPPCP